MAGAFLALGAGLGALVLAKGSRHHIIAGRWFIVGMGMAVSAGVLLVIPPGWSFALLILLVVFLVGTGYLAPSIGRGSPSAYRWDRLLTVVGALASLGCLYYGIQRTTLPSRLDPALMYGALGAGVAIAHWRWPGTEDAHRWRVEHLTSLLAAYTVAWVVISSIYFRWLGATGRSLLPAAIGTTAILWARRHFRPGGITRPAGRAVRGAA